MEVRPVPKPRRKLQRITRACDFCHRRGLKCTPSAPAPITLDGGGQSDCLTCIEHGQQCTRLREPQKRGTKPRCTKERLKDSRAKPPLGAFSLPLGSRDQLDDHDRPNLPSSGRVVSPDDLRVDRLLETQKSMTALIDIYLDSIYPLYPFFCETELLILWREGSILPGQPYYRSLITMCALSACQANKGALFTTQLSHTPDKQLAEYFLDEALRIVPLTYDDGDINLLRSYGLLALIGKQIGDTGLLHRYLGLYQGLSAHISFHNEDRWPSTLSSCEKETWRRLFWVMYRLEVHNACVVGHPIRIPESQTMVGYPCGVHHAPLLPGRNGKFENWFAGWNFTTDLYRILEHAIVDFRTKRTASATVLWSRNPSKIDSILQQLSVMQSNLMPQFAQAAMRSFDSGSNRSGFQVANILCTIHLVKMVAFASEDASFGDACQTAKDLIVSMSTVPRDYVRAFGTPLLQELSGVGHMLTSVTGQRLSDDEHLRLRGILMSLADYIESLGDCIESAATAGFRLRTSIARIDQAFARAVQSDSPHSRQVDQCSPSVPESDPTDGDQSTTATAEFFPYETPWLQPASQQGLPFNMFTHPWEYGVS